MGAYSRAHFMSKATQEFEAPDNAAKAAAAADHYQSETHDLVGDRMVLNMGPSHPATHGVLRLILELDGEVICKADPDIGFLHRGDEKIAENMHYNQFVPYTDRLDYLAPLANNVAYAHAVDAKQWVDRMPLLLLIVCSIALGIFPGHFYDVVRSTVEPMVNRINHVVPLITQNTQGLFP